MTNKRLQEFLKEYPGDYQICFSRALIAPFKSSDLEPDVFEEMFPDGETPEEDEYYIELNVPMCGIAVHEGSDEIKFMVSPKDAMFIENHLLPMDDFIFIDKDDEKEEETE